MRLECPAMLVHPVNQARTVIQVLQARTVIQVDPAQSVQLVQLANQATMVLPAKMVFPATQELRAK